ncbi:Hint domain-containing protein [Pyxidicoccus xibeiensis]|uniref:Hint domain-containing protein n=1 Tax=Pyxidicoccus xibeiensis TaxID=2906759 RepID=UPI0020A72BD1|nr:Hint domain-containing protein [Pyxidicoccus xibeiensis]MCP3144118.1 Hint domain-containing protein [Pyxidicoccus xibeiensis]
MKTHRSSSQWKSLFTTVLPLAALTATGAWAGPLRPLTEGLDQATLKADAQHMRRLFEKKAPASTEDFVHIDLADPAQHRFVMNRLHAAGKTQRNAPRLFERLAMARQKALTRKEPGIGRSTLTTEAWGCDHFVVLDNGATVSGERQYTSGPVGSCLNGASYIYADVVATNANYAETDATIVASAADEEYAKGTNFNTVAVNPSLPVNGQRQLIIDSMMIAMNEDTGEERVTFTASQVAVTTVAASVNLEHPRFSGAVKPSIASCQLRGGNDCDYAVVNNALQPYAASATGIAMRNPAISSWTGDGAAFFPFPTGTSFSSSKVYVPLKLTFDAGSDLTACNITSVLPVTKLRLIKTIQGGTCVTSADLQQDFNAGIGHQTAPVNRLLDLSRETPAAGTAAADCSMARITNEAVELALTISTKANCGRGEVNRTVTYRSKSKWNWDLYVWNSCMAEGTKIVRADGTSAPVESIQRGEQVVANDSGLLLTVTDVSRGGEDKPLVRLGDDKGHQVLLTETHPVLTSKGAVAAAALKVGDRVMTQAGAATLTTVKREAYAGQVYNLTLGTEQELLAAGKLDRTMYANGFRVGDNTMQAELSGPKAKTGPVLARLPKAWHADYRNSPSFQR